MYKEQFDFFLQEDELQRSSAYLLSLPTDSVTCKLKLKDDLILAGTPFFQAVFEHLGQTEFEMEDVRKEEGKSFKKSDNTVIEFKLPFNIALTGERLALNLLQRASAIASYTSEMVKAANGVKILDTRKTTPGLRFIEKYAVKIGGGDNHRLSQTDIWMIKDNHKNFFGGVEEAIKHFRKVGGFYQPIVLEIHEVEEIEPAISMGVKHFLLDNFDAKQIKLAVALKKPGMTYELSGGIHLDNLNTYDLSGIDCVSSGSLTYNAPHKDISLKINE